MCPENRDYTLAASVKDTKLVVTYSANVIRC